MIKILLILTLLFTHSLRAAEINHATGFGLQYAGVLGYRISTKNNDHRFRGALGLIGVSVGYDYFLSPQWSLGATYTETVRTVYSVNINYTLPQNEGITFGVDFGHIPSDKASGSGFTYIKGNSKNIMFFSVGYEF